MATLKLTSCTISPTDLIVAFPSKGDAEAWARSGGLYGNVAMYNGEPYPVMRPGTYVCTRWFPAHPATTLNGLTIFIKEYETEQYHPRIRLPYRAWAVVVADH